MAHLLKKTDTTTKQRLIKFFAHLPLESQSVLECCHDHGSCDDKAKL